MNYDGVHFTVKTHFGPVQIDRKSVESILFRPLSGKVPPVSAEAKKMDQLIYSAGDSSPPLVWSGRIRIISDSHIELKVGEEVKQVAREKVEELRFPIIQNLPSPPSGLFAKIRLQNGDLFVGVLSSSPKNTLRFFSPLLGGHSLSVERISSVQFISEARATWGRILICDRSGIQEVDRNGKVHWSYTKNVQFAWGAVHLKNGNVLVAATNFNQILEVSPKGEVVWRLSGVSYPYDVERLSNGNTLVAEYTGNQVSEFNLQGKRVWKSTRILRPTSVQRLDNGDTLVGSDSGVFEISPEGKQKWKAPLTRIRPWRARRLENGNTLICDQRRGQVVEVSRAGNEVWKMTGLGRPMSALRMENGRTLILEQSSNRVIEVDRAGRILHQIDGFNYPQAISIY
ncbi:MAG: hypothetical protein QF645_06140 [Planctomycetota bacterium]|nr:hypothetical protein [Planctomycetota bacterium]